MKKMKVIQGLLGILVFGLVFANIIAMKYINNNDYPRKTRNKPVQVLGKDLQSDELGANPVGDNQGDRLVLAEKIESDSISIPEILRGVSIISALPLVTGWAMEETKSSFASLSVVGDLMAHQWQLDFAYNAETEEYDFYKSLEVISPYLSGDYVIGNLETVLGDSKFSDYPRFHTPKSYGEALKQAGFDFLSTANNHSNDQLENGILRTIDVLDELGMDHVGTYQSAEERNQIFVKNIQGIHIAFLSYTYGTNGLPLTKGKDYLCNLMDKELIKSDLERARNVENVDLVVVMPHMGNEYELIPKGVFKEWTLFMLESGADMVLASHPHVVQPIETIEFTRDGEEREGLIVYCPGNFFSSQRTLPREAGIIVNIDIEKKPTGEITIKAVSYTSTWVQFYDMKNRYQIQVLPVDDSIIQATEGILSLRQQDINRLKNIKDSHQLLFDPIESQGSKHIILKDMDIK